MGAAAGRSSTSRWALVSLLLANLVPVTGVFLWGWQPREHGTIRRQVAT